MHKKHQASRSENEAVGRDGKAECEEGRKAGGRGDVGRRELRTCKKLMHEQNKAGKERERDWGEMQEARYRWGWWGEERRGRRRSRKRRRINNKWASGFRTNFKIGYRA